MFTGLDEPPPAEPFDIFQPHGPIDPIFIERLLEALHPTQPDYVAASPDRQADLRLVTMHGLAAFHPTDAAQAMLAAQLVALHPHVLDSLRCAAAPEATEANAMRHRGRAATLSRCALATLRTLLRLQGPARRAAARQAEPAGYVFTDISVPASEGFPDTWQGDATLAATDRSTGFGVVGAVADGDGCGFPAFARSAAGARNRADAADHNGEAAAACGGDNWVSGAAKIWGAGTVWGAGTIWQDNHPAPAIGSPDLLPLYDQGSAIEQGGGLPTPRDSDPGQGGAPADGDHPADDRSPWRGENRMHRETPPSRPRRWPPGTMEQWSESSLL